MINLKTNAAISQRLKNICKERNLSINKLASLSCLTQSTVQNIIECNYQNVKVLTIVRICDGLGMSLKQFFDDQIFDNLDRED